MGNRGGQRSHKRKTLNVSQRAVFLFRLFAFRVVQYRADELGKLKRFAPHDAALMRRIRRWLHRDEQRLPEPARATLAAAFAKSKALATVYSMRRELAALWERSSASGEQLVRELQDWCRRAEASGIVPLAEFSIRLRSYA